MSDGCTLWFNGDWRQCCDWHDFQYATGIPKVTADLDLAACVAHTGHGIMGLIMLAGVTLFGWLFYRKRR